MYNERKDSFSIKDVVLQILFVVLFIFILMWLFPSKSFLKDSLEPLYDRIFNENILNMKESAKGYYTTPRLPQKVGDKVSMTLGDMLDKKLLIPFKDSKGRSCDNTSSYVQVTKMDEEYIMKVNLKCSEQENYILVYMGCYDYCKTTICEKEQSDVKTPTILPSRKPNDPTNPSKPTPTPVNPGKPTPTPVDPSKPTPTPEIPKEYVCKYVKTVDAEYTKWSNWSGWSTTPKYDDDLTKVESKTETTYTTERVKVAEKITTRTITYKDAKKPIYGYKNVTIQIGTENKNVCTASSTKLVGTGVYKYGAWNLDAGVKQVASRPVDTDLIRWYWISNTTQSCDCAWGRYQIWGYDTRQKYEVKEERTVCTKWEVKSTPIYTTQKVKVIIDYGTSQRVEKTVEPIYENVKVPHKTKYYRYSTRTLKDGWRDELWSKCDNNELTDKGYKWTGEKKEK